MVKKIVLTIALAAIIFGCFIMSIFASEDNYISATYQSEEYLNGKSIADWLILNNGFTLNGVDAWSDGSFFVNFGTHINFYDNLGNFTHSLDLKGGKGGTIKARALGDSDLQLLLYRGNVIVTMNKQGQISSSLPLSYEAFKEAEEELLKVEANYFSQKEIALTVQENEALIVVIPADLAIPFTSVANIKILKLSNGTETTLYNDNGIIAFKLFLSRFVLSSVIIVILLIVVKKTIKHRKDRLNNLEN